MQTCWWSLSDHWSVHLTSFYLPGSVWYGGLETHWSYLRYGVIHDVLCVPLQAVTVPETLQTRVKLKYWMLMLNSWPWYKVIAWICRSIFFVSAYNGVTWNIKGRILFLNINNKGYIQQGKNWIHLFLGTTPIYNAEMKMFIYTSKIRSNSMHQLGQCLGVWYIHFKIIIKV